MKPRMVEEHGWFFGAFCLFLAVQVIWPGSRASSPLGVAAGVVAPFLAHTWVPQLAAVALSIALALFGLFAAVRILRVPGDVVTRP